MVATTKNLKHCWNIMGLNKKDINISVVIPLYNKEKSIHRTIKSVLEQKYLPQEILIINDGSTDNSKNEVLKFSDHRIRIIDSINQGVSSARNIGIIEAKCEYIVIDGSSTDESCELLQAFKQPELSGFRFISEPDTGIYNAMNKGISMAKGRYLLFINSGDELADNNVIENFLNEVKPESEICSGNLVLINNSEQLILKSPSEITLSYCINAGITHPNTFISKSLFEKYGYYNEANKIVSDWEFFLIAAGLNNCKYQKLDFTVAKFYEDGISSQNKKLVADEMDQVIHRLVPSPILKDISRLQQLESQCQQPYQQFIQHSTLTRRLLTILYRLRKNLVP